MDQASYQLGIYQKEGAFEIRGNVFSAGRGQKYGGYRCWHI
jgi:hypothetical protein